MTMERCDFENSLLNPLDFWADKSKDEVRDYLGSEAARMVDFDQRNPHHCYDLFHHSLHTVEGIPQQSKILLRVAAFFHDIGKPDVAMEKQGKLVFYGHAKKSSEISERLLKQLGYNQEERVEICFYIEHHDDFISWVMPDEKRNTDNPYLVEINQKNMEKQMKKVMEKNEIFLQKSPRNIWINLITLCEADVSAQAENVYKEGRILIDSRQNKLNKIRMIRMYMESIMDGYE
jgi:hypothetical protein